MSAPLGTMAPVLVLLSLPRDGERTRDFLAAEGLDGVCCKDLADLCERLRGDVGAVIVAEEFVRRSQGGGLEEALRAQPAWSAIPLVVLTVDRNPARQELMLSGTAANVTLVERPVRTRTLLSVVRAALKARRHQFEIRDAIIERERQAAVLREGEERLQFALDAGRLGAWEYNIVENTLHASASCKASYGFAAGARFTLEDLLGAMHPDDRPRWHSVVNRVLAERLDFDIEYRVVWGDESEHWLMVRGRTLYAPDGRPLKMTGVTLDVTERKRTEAELASQAEQLREADRRKDEFLATLAHELRNPLAPVRTGIYVLRHAPVGPVADKAREMIDRQVGHMVRLIDDLLDVSRITRGKLELRRERITVRSVLEAAVEASRPLIDRARHRLEVVQPKDELWVDGDPTRLAQVVSNLLNNAAKYTPDHGVLRLSVRREGGEACIEVADNGAGIPHDQLESVFHMFSQVDRTLDRAQGGLGIGLALVQMLVALHGGRVEAASQGLGKGSTFTVRLPLDAHTHGPTEMVMDTKEKTVGRTILVVDDNEDAAEWLTMFLQLLGHTTETAHDGPEAIAAASKMRPEVVFLDIGLPGMSGYDVARTMREDPAMKDAVLVALTGWGTDDDKRKAKEAGFNHHLTKPVETDKLESLLAELPRKEAASG